MKKGRKRVGRGIISSVFPRIAICVVLCGLPALAGCIGSVGGKTGVSQKQGVYVEVYAKWTWDPPGSELADFNASEALLNVSMSNAEVTSTSGTATVTVTNASNGTTLGQQSFGYVVKGSSLYAADPTAVQNWLGQFTGYSDVAVSVSASDLSGQDTATSGTASATTSAEYNGTTYASSTATWPIGSSGTGCGTGQVKCVQQ